MPDRTTRRRRTRTGLFAIALLVLLAGCGGPAADDGVVPAPQVPAVSTLSPLPAPSSKPPTGKIVADLRQSSRDAALGRLRVPMIGDRLRNIPAGSMRGYPLYLPEPACSGRGRAGPLTVRYAGTQVQLDVTDDNDIVARFTDRRCLELAVGRVATLAFADEVEVVGDGVGSTARLVLLAEPSGVPGGVLTIDEVHGTPVFSAEGESVWTPDVTVRSDGPAQRVELSVVPARCDPHVFGESGGATAFLIRLRLNGKPGDIVLWMSPAGAKSAIDFAVASCGLG